MVINGVLFLEFDERFPVVGDDVLRLDILPLLAVDALDGQDLQAYDLSGLRVRPCTFPPASIIAQDGHMSRVIGWQDGRKGETDSIIPASHDDVVHARLGNEPVVEEE